MFTFIGRKPHNYEDISEAKENNSITYKYLKQKG